MAQSKMQPKVGDLVYCPVAPGRDLRAYNCLSPLGIIIEAGKKWDLKEIGFGWTQEMINTGAYRIEWFADFRDKGSNLYSLENAINYRSAYLNFATSIS